MTNIVLSLLFLKLLSKLFDLFGESREVKVRDPFVSLLELLFGIVDFAHFRLIIVS